MLKDIIKQHFKVTGKLKLFKIQITIKTVRYHQDQVLYSESLFSLAWNRMVCQFPLMPGRKGRLLNGSQ